MRWPIANLLAGTVLGIGKNVASIKFSNFVFDLSSYAEAEMRIGDLGYDYFLIWSTTNKNIEVGRQGTIRVVRHTRFHDEVHYLLKKAVLCRWYVYDDRYVYQFQSEEHWQVASYGREDD